MSIRDRMVQGASSHKRYLKPCLKQTWRTEGSEKVDLRQSERRFMVARIAVESTVVAGDWFDPAKGGKSG